jgi:hypothetical protein
MQPSEAAFELGDDSTWNALQKYSTPGTAYKVFCNDRLRLSGRVEFRDVPFDADGGASMRFTVRTKLADAQYATADPNLSSRGASLKDFLIKLYKPLGYAAKDFIFDDPSLSRDLLTGESTGGKGSPKKIDLEPMKPEEARPQAQETIYDCADRHLRRFGLIHWDSPDGKICVGAPNDTQDPIYTLHCGVKNKPQLNNVLKATLTTDWSGIPSKVAVSGRAGKPGFQWSRVGAIATDNDVAAAGFYRPVVLPADGLRTNDLAERAARRELAARSKRKDCWEVEVGGLGFWDGSKNVPWGVDCTVSMEVDNSGSGSGAYYVHRVVMRRDPGGGDVTNLSLLRRGIWIL